MCLFCDIATHKIPSKTVYEDDDVICFLDLAQTTKGHTLVVPKKHSDNVFEMDKETLANVMEKAQDIGKLVKNKLNATGMNILINTGESAGQTIKHTHVHLIPRYDTSDTIKFEFKENKLDLDEVLNEIKK